MADNSSLPVASGNETFANNDIGGVKYPRQKSTWGPAGTANDTDVASGKAMPVQLRSATGLIPVGEPTDAKSASTDTTSVSMISVLKQVSAELQLLRTALGSTALDLGVSTGGTRTLRMAIDTAQLDPTVAHDAVDSGTPYKQGGRAVAGLSGLTLVSAGDRTDSLHGIDGAKYVRPHCGLEDIVSGLLANTDGASTAVIAAQGAGVKVYITSVIIANTSATAVTVDLRDGAAGSVKATFPVPANTSGVVCNLPVPLGFSANTAVCMDGSAAASTVTCTLIGFKSKV